MSTTFKTGSITPDLTKFEELKVQRYDQVASWLIALLVSFGTVTGAMLLIWWGSTIRYHPKKFDLEIEEEGYGRGDHAKGFARDEKGPGDPDLPQLEEPAGSELFDQTEPAPAMAFVEEAAAATIAEFGDIAATSDPTPRGPGFGGTGGGEGGLGDSRPPGPLGDGVMVVPRWERWETQFTSASINAYAQQLDSFGIELAALGRKKDIDYAFNLAKPKPDTRTGPSKPEKRLYMSWKKGPLQQFDRELLRRAGIETAGRLLVQFYPKEVENTLAQLEQANAGGRSKREYLKTVFGIRLQRGRPEFFVIEQTFRSMPKL